MKIIRVEVIMLLIVIGGALLIAVNSHTDDSEASDILLAPSEEQLAVYVNDPNESDFYDQYQIDLFRKNLLSGKYPTDAKASLVGIANSENTSATNKDLATEAVLEYCKTVNVEDCSDGLK